MILPLFENQSRSIFSLHNDFFYSLFVLHCQIFNVSKSARFGKQYFDSKMLNDSMWQTS